MPSPTRTPGVEADTDEQPVVMLGFAVLDLLRRNPHPVTYLTKAVSP